MSEGTDSGTVRSSQRVDRGAGPYLIVAVVAMWLSRSFWWPGRYVVGFDTYAYSGPNVEVTEEAWRHLRLPVLNELIFGGVPHLGNPSAGSLYVPQLVTLVFGTNRGMGILVALHLVVLGLGMVWLARRLGIGRIGATVAGLLLVASGAMLTKTTQYEQILVIAWAPLLLVAIHAVLHNERPWRAVGGMSAVTATVLLAGHPQLVYETMLLAVAATIGFTIGGERWRRLPHLAGGAVLGALIALPQLVAVVYATSDSILSLGRNQDLEDPALALLPSSTARALLGTVQNVDPARFVGGFESIAFLGVVGAVLAVIGFTEAVIRPERRPWAISFGVIGRVGTRVGDGSTHVRVRRRVRPPPGLRSRPRVGPLAGGRDDRRLAVRRRRCRRAHPSRPDGPPRRSRGRDPRRRGRARPRRARRRSAHDGACGR